MEKQVINIIFILLYFIISPALCLAYDRPEVLNYFTKNGDLVIYIESSIENVKSIFFDDKDTYYLFKQLKTEGNLKIYGNNTIIIKNRSILNNVLPKKIRILFLDEHQIEKDMLFNDNNNLNKPTGLQTLLVTGTVYNCLGHNTEFYGKWCNTLAGAGHTITAYYDVGSGLKELGSTTTNSDSTYAIVGYPEVTWYGNVSLQVAYIIVYAYKKDDSTVWDSHWGTELLVPLITNTDANLWLSLCTHNGETIIYNACAAN